MGNDMGLQEKQKKLFPLFPPLRKTEKETKGVR
jgi:hypothetical protein